MLMKEVDHDADPCKDYGGGVKNVKLENLS
jgi:hypothetical protein